MNAPTIGFFLGCAALVCEVSAQDKTPPEFVALKDQFDVKVKSEVQQIYDFAVADLNTKYAAALDRAQKSAQQAGKLEDALGIKKEVEELALRNAVPTTDDENTPLVLKQLRGNYRMAIGRLEEERVTKLRLLQAAFAKSLDALVVSLTQKRMLEEAIAVKKYRDELASSVQLPGPTTSGQRTVAITSSATGAPFVNTLGMKFVRVPGTSILMCIHETRRQDYAAYAAAVTGIGDAWANQNREGVPCGHENNHPVVGVSRDDAQAFCAWLTQKEGKTYRLPTDQEWSEAVGIGGDEKWTEGTTPEMMHGKVADTYPWGSDFPPTTKDLPGNFGDTAWREKFPALTSIESYTDGFPTTAPVMSFKPNKLGLYDMGGNVWEWVEDWWNSAKTNHVLRGGSFGNSTREHLLSSYRDHPTPGPRSSNGFRCVLVESGVLVQTTPKVNPGMIAYDFEVALSRKRDDHRKAMEGNKIVVYETWKYGIKIENKSKTGSAGVTASGLELRYNISKTPKARGTQTRAANEGLVAVSGLLIKAGAVELVDIKPQSTVETATDVIPITHSELAPGWYYTDGTKDEHNDDLEGIWLQIVKDGNVVFEKKQGSKAAEGAKWVAPPKPTSSSN